MVEDMNRSVTSVTVKQQLIELVKQKAHSYQVSSEHSNTDHIMPAATHGQTQNVPQTYDAAALLAEKDRELNRYRHYCDSHKADHDRYRSERDQLKLRNHTLEQEVSMQTFMRQLAYARHIAW